MVDISICQGKDHRTCPPGCVDLAAQRTPRATGVFMAGPWGKVGSKLLGRPSRSPSDDPTGHVGRVGA